MTLLTVWRSCITWFLGHNYALRQSTAVYPEFLASEFQRVPRQPDHTFHITCFVRNGVPASILFRFVRVTRILEDDYVTASDLSLREKPVVVACTRSHDELVYQKVIAD